MEKQELLKYCEEKNVLLDNSLLRLFLDFENLEILKLFLDKLKNLTGKRFFNEALIKANKEKINKILREISILKKVDFKIFNDFFDLGNIEVENEDFIVNNKEGIVKIKSSFPCIGKSLGVKDFVVHFRNRYESLRNIMQDRTEFENLISINKISSDKQKLSVIGLISSKKITKNKNVILEIEDLTGKMKVLISSEKEDLLKEVEDIALDSVIGFKGFGNNDILFVNEIVFPDCVLNERKKSDVEECAIFLGDIHYGSRNFLRKDFSKFIDYLSPESKDPEVDKIKYLFIIGDLITGVGNYPNQEKDLVVGDVEQQFQEMADLLGKIRKDIKIIICPGNHDCVRLMEPQPLLDEKYAWPLYELPNVIITENPSTINVGETESFEGFDVLCYHGFSFPYYANNVPKLMLEKTMNEPEKIMKYLLKNRHLAPTHTSVQYFPLEKDALLIKKSPDIFVAGHTHKSGVTYYNNILLVSISSWEGMTDYQEKFGNTPDHCKVPLFNLKTRAVKILDFETGEDEIKTYRGEDGK